MVHDMLIALLSVVFIAPVLVRLVSVNTEPVEYVNAGYPIDTEGVPVYEEVHE